MSPPSWRVTIIFFTYVRCQTYAMLVKRTYEMRTLFVTCQLTPILTQNLSIVSKTVPWCLYHAALYPQMQTRIHGELSHVQGRAHIQPSALPELKYVPSVTSPTHQSFGISADHNLWCTSFSCSRTGFDCLQPKIYDWICFCTLKALNLTTT